MKTYVLTSFVFLLFQAAISQPVSWEPLNGPFGGTALSFASTNEGVVFAGTGSNQNCIYRSTDSGLTWLIKNSGIANVDRQVEWMIADDSSFIIIGTSSHIGSLVYKSVDNGDNWIAIENMGGTSVSKNSSGHIYAGNTGYGQYSISSDGGYSWNHFPHPSPFINCIEINNSGHIYVGGNYTGYRSVDNGTSWETLSLPDGINSFAFAPDGTIFSGCSREYAANSGVYRSTDNGENWMPVKEGVRVYASHNLIINDEGSVLAGTWGTGVWKSADNGDTWTQCNNGLEHLYVKSMHITAEGIVYAGLTSGGIYKSVDFGDSWEQVGLTLANVKKIEFNPECDLMLAAVYGISRSTDHGLSWQPCNAGLNNLDMKSLAIKSDGTIFAGSAISNWASPNDCLFRSTDNALTWTVVTNGLQIHDVEAITFDNAGNVYAGNYFGVFKSENNGDNWVNTGGAGGARSLQFNDFGDLFLASYGQGLWKLPAGDTIWVDLTSNVGSYWLPCMLISANGNIYVAGKRSVDNGITWTNMGASGSGISCFAENSAGHLFAGDYYSGVYRSIDEGDTWQQINTGLQIMDIRSLAVDQEDYLYAGTNGNSVYRTTSSTITSADALSSPSYKHYLKQNQPNPFRNSTSIQWCVPENTRVVLSVLDFTGREIRTLVNQKIDKGDHRISFNAEGLPAGIYFYQLQLDGIRETRKMILLK